MTVVQKLVLKNDASRKVSKITMIEIINIKFYCAIPLAIDDTKLGWLRVTHVFSGRRRAISLQAQTLWKRIHIMPKTKKWLPERRLPMGTTGLQVCTGYMTECNRTMRLTCYMLVCIYVLDGQLASTSWPLYCLQLLYAVYHPAIR